MQQEPRFERVHLLPQPFMPNPLPQSDHLLSPHEDAHGQTVVFQVQGMSCASCAITIARVLKRLAGVQDVRIDAQTGRTELLCTQVSPSRSFNTPSRVRATPCSPGGSLRRSRPEK